MYDINHVYALRIENTSESDPHSYEVTKAVAPKPMNYEALLEVGQEWVQFYTCNIWRRYMSEMCNCFNCNNSIPLGTINLHQHVLHWAVTNFTISDHDVCENVERKLAVNFMLHKGVPRCQGILNSAVMWCWLLVTYWGQHKFKINTIFVDTVPNQIRVFMAKLEVQSCGVVDQILYPNHI